MSSYFVRAVPHLAKISLQLVFYRTTVAVCTILLADIMCSLGGKNGS